MSDNVVALPGYSLDQISGISRPDIAAALARVSEMALAGTIDGLVLVATRADGEGGVVRLMCSPANDLFNMIGGLEYAKALVVREGQKNAGEEERTDEFHIEDPA